jgi:DNA-binding HxlR family transcriptional regulator
MKTYRQYCTVARGLDLIGERWVLLIIREMLDGRRRYSDLLRGLPGIATNLLAERLRTMQRDGLVECTDGGRYVLTAHGEGLRDVVDAISRWAWPLMDQPREGAPCRSQ